MMYMWLALMVALLVIEGVTAGLYTVWFAIGAMVSALCAAAGLPDAAQIAVFLVVSVMLLLFLRPAARKIIPLRGTAKTNADRVFERTGVVTEAIDNITAKGAVYVDGKTWTARSYTGEPIPVDTPVSVNMIEGVKLIVSVIERESAPEPAPFAAANPSAPPVYEPGDTADYL